MAEKKYKVLSRGSIGLQHCRLYRADDHLLQVTGTYIEEYRKFYYSDIKGALIQQHPVKSRIAAITLLILTILSVVLLSLSYSGAWELGIFCSVITVVLAFYLLPALVTGGFASLYLVTSVQHGRITAVNSRRKARKVVNFIQQQLETHAPDRSQHSQQTPPLGQP